MAHSVLEGKRAGRNEERESMCMCGFSFVFKIKTRLKIKITEKHFQRGKDL